MSDTKTIQAYIDEESIHENAVFSRLEVKESIQQEFIEQIKIDGLLKTASYDPKNIHLEDKLEDVVMDQILSGIRSD